MAREGIHRNNGAQVPHDGIKIVSDARPGAGGVVAATSISPIACCIPRSEWQA